MNTQLSGSAAYFSLNNSNYRMHFAVLIVCVSHLSNGQETNIIIRKIFE